MWFKDNAKWVIVFFGVLIIFGLIMMDRAGSMSNLGHESEVAKVDGESIDIETFQRDMQNYLRSEEARTGKAPEGLQQAQMREGLLQYKIQSLLLGKLYAKYRLYSSVEEMQDFLKKNPNQVAGAINQYEGPNAIPVFLRDSILDTTRYIAWLSQDSVYDRPALRVLEDQLRNVIVPQGQLQLMLSSQWHRTRLEESYATEVRETSAKLVYYQVPFDSIAVDKSKFKEADLKRYYEAHPDSFYFKDVAARMTYVRLPVQPSRHDTDLMLDFAKELKSRALAGEKFDEMAKAYSNDPGSAEQGGHLGGFQPKTSWVPAFGDAGFALDSGEISEPVLTQFGVHLIQSHGKKTEDSLLKADLSHILLKITAGIETTDSLLDLAAKIKEKAAAQNSLQAAAESYGLAVDTTPVFEKGNLSPLGPTYVPGLNSFAFSPYEKDAYSEPLQSDEGVYVFSRYQTFAKGRDFNRAQETIQDLLIQEEKRELAQKALETQLSAIQNQPDTALAPTLGKAMLDSSALVSAENWVPGFGYRAPALFTAIHQEKGKWGPVLTSDMAALVAKVVEKKVPTPQELNIKTTEARTSPDDQMVNTLLQQFLTELPKTAKVVNKLDQVYRN